jgi:predicted nucleic acid-binding protein
MKAVFADTSYWFALLNTRDALHQKAIVMSRQLSAVPLVTSEMVFVELLNSVSSGNPRERRAVVSAVQGFRGSDSVIVVPQTPEQFAIAFDRYKQSADKNWSLTDCASFQIMETEGISAALTHDHHFVQAGFEALLR